jgi:hypothetical protein
LDRSVPVPCTHLSHRSEAEQNQWSRIYILPHHRWIVVLPRTFQYREILQRIPKRRRHLLTVERFQSKSPLERPWAEFMTPLLRLVCEMPFWTLIRQRSISGANKMELSHMVLQVQEQSRKLQRNLLSRNGRLKTKQRVIHNRQVESSHRQVRISSLLK